MTIEEPERHLQALYVQKTYLAPISNGRFVSGQGHQWRNLYFRFSTREQVLSGWGLEGQEGDINYFLETHNQDTYYEVVGRYVEVHSGSDDPRPELPKSIENAKEMKGILIVSQLERLSRKVSFIS